VVEEILSGLWRIEVPLPHNPLKAINSYLIKGDGRFLLIDTGMNVKEGITALTSGLRKLKVDLARTDFFITHLHHDHMGLLSTLATEKSTVYFNQPEAPIIKELTSNSRWAKLLSIYASNGFPMDGFTGPSASGVAHLYGPELASEITILRDGDKLEAGGYRFRCILTPGHSPGHTCLYEEDKKILFSGDHILFDITPHISYWPDVDNSLKQYLDSLDKIYPLDVKLVLPGHRNREGEHKSRIRALKLHHQNRLKEILKALESGESNAYQVASRITWEITIKKWENFPVAQKYFATGEAISHLEYLADEGTVKKRSVDGKILYSLA
jgi:glyoxylase-like metal-dependent hydrolase (beta-lactamase superfamily II)